MNLLVFDIDGTLTDTTESDDRLYLEALREAGVTGAVPAWETFSEVTDPAIARALITQQTGRRVPDAELFAIRQLLATKWQHAIKHDEILVRPRPGALEIVQAARARSDCHVAIATGGWSPTAVLKLRCAGFPVDELVLATADDAEARPAIIRTAAMLAAAARGTPGFSKMVVIGDGVWDARAARAVRAGFVGVCADPAAALQLRAEGAAAVIASLAEPDAFWAAVDAAVALRHSAASN